MIRRLMLTPVFVLLIWAVPAGGQSPAVPYKTLRLDIEPGITAPVAGDFTGDRIPDLVVHMPTEIRIYPGDGKGAFALAIVTSIGGTETRRHPHAAITGDFNRDGKLDFFAFQRVFLGNGDGTLTSVGSVEIDDQPSLLDVNFDGIPDLAGLAGQRFLVFLGTGDGTFCNPPCAPWRTISVKTLTALGDLNRDGSPDLVTVSFSRKSFSFESTLSVGDSDISDAYREWNGSQWIWDWGTPRAIALQDVNGDGWSDLIVMAGWIIVAQGQGNGSFGKPYVAAVGTRTVYFEGYDDTVFADFNGDGILDFGYLMSYDEPDIGYEAGILYGDGQGKFSQSIPFHDGIRQTGPVSGTDWNGDGLPDLLYSDGATLYLSRSTPVAFSSASRRTAVAPGSLATIYGTNLAPAEASAPRFAVPPKTLEGVSIQVTNGSSSWDVDLVSVAPSHVKFRIPPNMPPGQSKGRVLGPGGIYEFSVWVQSQAPGIFTTDGIHAVAAVAASGSNVEVLLYGTGWNGVPASGTTIVVNGTEVAADSVFSIPGLAGLDLVRFQIPPVTACGYPVCYGDTLVRAKVGGAESNRAVLSLGSIR